MNKSIWVIFVLAILSNVSCEERQVVIPDFVEPDSDRVVLLEELTGVRCPNCPGGSAEIKRLVDRYGDNIVPVAYHTTFLGYPFPDSKYNFLTDEAEELEDYLGDYLGKPAASINRVVREDNTVFNSSTGEWSGFVDEALQSFSQVILEGSVALDTNSRIADIDILLTAKNNDLMEGDYKITVLAKESKIIDVQLLPQGERDEEYEHNHVFRQFLSNLTGDPINQVLEENIPISFEYSLDVKEEWVAENMHIVAFVEYQEGGRPVEVLQALQIPLKE